MAKLFLNLFLSIILGIVVFCLFKVGVYFDSLFNQKTEFYFVFQNWLAVIVSIVIAFGFFVTSLDKPEINRKK